MRAIVIRVLHAGRRGGQAVSAILVDVPLTTEKAKPSPVCTSRGLVTNVT